MFDKLLVANRGEIACRIMRTAQRLGISCTAIYSDSDQTSMHVAQADEAFRVGSNAATDSYLNTEHIIDAVRRSGANAVLESFAFDDEIDFWKFERYKRYYLWKSISGRY